MSRSDKRKMDFAAAGRQGSQEIEDDDIVNKEMDDIFQEVIDQEVQPTPVRKLPRVRKPRQDSFREEDEEEYSAKFLEDVLEEEEDESGEPKELQTAPSTPPNNGGNAAKAKMSEIFEESSDDEQDLSNTSGHRRKKSLSYFKGSSYSMVLDDDLKPEQIPHNLFIQLNELFESDDYPEWRETARWVRYEENVEEGADRWGQPHLPSLSFHSLLNVRRCLETGIIMLEMGEKNLALIVTRAVETMYSEGLIRLDDREQIFDTIMLHHFPRSVRTRLPENTQNNHWTRRSAGSIKRFNRRGSTAVFNPIRASSMFGSMRLSSEEKEQTPESRPLDVKLVMEPPEAEPLLGPKVQLVQNEYLLRRLPLRCHGAVVLAGNVDYLENPTIAFIRFAEAVKIPNLLEVAIPIRFMFILLGPKSVELDYHEIGRSISTLMANKSFAALAYKARNRKELILAINEFLDGSIVLPPGKYDKESLLPFEELKEKSDMIRRRKRRVLASRGASLLNEAQMKFLTEKFEANQKKDAGPLQKTGRLWGGMISDLKRRLPMFKSDIVDGLNSETLAATVFMYFACFATAITFGGLADDLTKGFIGISETLIAACIVGMVFHLLGGQPLVIAGATGPLILFDKALVSFCEIQGFNFLNVRVYIGFWLIVIGLTVSAFEGSTYVRLFSRFTQEIFSALITLIYLYSTFNKTISVYKHNPLMKVSDYTLALNGTSTKALIENEPNTALFCTLLTLGTFVLAYSLKIFRNSKFLGRSSRRALGDFGVPISIAIFVVIANICSGVKTEKLNVPDGISPTYKIDGEFRPWLVPLWLEDNPIWLPFICIVPSFLVYILVFMESHISELILDKPERKLKKGSGFHWDIVLLCFLNCFCGLFGMPWHCLAAVRSVAHISSVTVMSTTHPPGESPHIIGVKEQKVSGFCVSLMIGLSIIASPILKKIPISVLFGVFLYMGICSMNGVHLFERIVLFFVPVKYHPHVPYATKVLTWRMNVYTAVQVIALAILWTVNESPISLAFPFFLIMMVPLRKVLEFFFSPSELEALDGVQEADDDDIDDVDFY